MCLRDLDRRSRDRPVAIHRPRDARMRPGRPHRCRTRSLGCSLQEQLVPAVLRGDAVVRVDLWRSFSDRDRDVLELEVLAVISRLPVEDARSIRNGAPHLAGTQEIDAVAAGMHRDSALRTRVVEPRRSRFPPMVVTTMTDFHGSCLEMATPRRWRVLFVHAEIQLRARRPAGYVRSQPARSRQFSHPSRRIIGPP